MSKYYDPWHHAIQLFFNRLIQFALLSLVLSLAVWAGLLHLVFEAGWKTVATFSWSMLSSTDLHWRTILGQSLAIGTLLTAWLFTWLIGRARLGRGERHHRGARVVHADAE